MYLEIMFSQSVYTCHLSFCGQTSFESPLAQYSYLLLNNSFLSMTITSLVVRQVKGNQ